MATEAPSPLHVLRTHTDPVTTLFCSTDNERIYSGDVKGRVVLTSSRSLRPIASWFAHSDALLGIEEVIEKKQVVTLVQLLWLSLTVLMCSFHFFLCPHHLATDMVETTKSTSGSALTSQFRLFARSEMQK